MGKLALGLWLAAIAICAVIVGERISFMLEGITPGRLGWLSFGLAPILVAVAIWATFRWARERSTAQARATSRTDERAALDRRGFLTGAALTAGGLAATGGALFGRLQGWVTVSLRATEPEVETMSPSPRAEWAGSRVKSYRRLGRTGAQVSDICLGSFAVDEKLGGVELAREAIARGINYFDTSPDYTASSSERALGRAMQGQREKMFVATRFCTPEGHLPAGSPVEAYMAAIDGSLERLQTSYVDLVHVHACNEIERLSDPNLHEAFRRLKEAGKVRFLGVSSHTPRLEQVANFAIDDGRFDVIMLAYHHGSWPNLGAIIDKAAKADVGVVAMKTLKGAKHERLDELRDVRDSYTQAAFKWVLANPSVSCLVISFWDPRQLDEYLYASGGTPSASDHAVLERYDRAIAGKHCFQHCGQCLAACPEGLAIDDVLRHRMYFEDYGRQKVAMSEYAKLEKQADVCVGCAAPCNGACPYGVPIQERTMGAHELLTLS
jgi:predicted aldo/keto reductase-like oxidoreductase